MTRCAEFEPLIEELLADEIGAAERDRLLRHAECCVRCREFVDLHHRMLGPELDVELPGQASFADMRRAVLRQLRARGVGNPRSTERLWHAFAGWRLRPALAGALLAGALLVAAGLGFGVGRDWGTTVLQPAGVTAQLEREARGHRLLSDVEESPFLYSNVDFVERGDGTLELAFDVTQHLRMVRPKDDPLVREMLVQSLLNASPVATRLRAMDVAGQTLQPLVKEALIVTMLNDPNQAVRQRALEILGTQPGDAEIQAALVAVLRDEESVHMRMRALDHLAETGRERLAQLIDELRPERDRALLVRAASYGAAVRDEPSTIDRR